MRDAKVELDEVFGEAMDEGFQSCHMLDEEFEFDIRPFGRRCVGKEGSLETASIMLSPEFGSRVESCCHQSRTFKSRIQPTMPKARPARTMARAIWPRADGPGSMNGNPISMVSRPISVKRFATVRRMTVNLS